jgi:site-specific DNA-methyltransferase (adenine-specific)
MTAIDLRLGAYQDVMQDVTCDALICDPPYGAGTHAGHNAGRLQVLSATGQDVMHQIAYKHWNAEHVSTFVDFWSARTRGWMACMTSHDLIPAYEAAFASAGRYHFAPVPIIQKRPRLVGDGPASWTVYLMTARPKSRVFATWGCLPGAYISQTAKTGIVAGAKPLDLMRDIVRDYSRACDAVADATAGGATTLIASAIEGRKAIGCEMDPKTHALAMNRIATSGEIEKYAPSDALKHAKQARLF